MLHSVTWAAFGEAVLILLLAYYCVVAGAFFRKEILGFVRRWGKRPSILILMSVASGGVVRAQTADANAGLNQANTMIRSYFDTGTQLMYAVGAILALCGAIHVFVIMGNEGRRHEVRTAVVAWFSWWLWLL